MGAVLMKQPSVECVLDVKAALGECPVWCGRAGMLYWVDIDGKRFNRFDPASGTNRAWSLPEKIGSFALCEDGGVLAALKSGIHRYDLDNGALTPLALPESGLADNRLNDGRCDPAGRFWFGSMREPPEAARATGTLYRLD